MLSPSYGYVTVYHTAIDPQRVDSEYGLGARLDMMVLSHL